jgi:hypothetical protein
MDMKQGVITVMKVDPKGKPVPTFADKARESRKSHFNPLLRRLFGVSNRRIVRESKSFALCAKFLVAAAEIESPATPESERTGRRLAWDRELFSLANKEEQLAVVSAIAALQAKFGKGWHSQVLGFSDAAARADFGDTFMSAPSKPRRLAKEVVAFAKASGSLQRILRLEGAAQEWELDPFFMRQSPLVQGLIAPGLAHLKPKA